jgi:hypothetical protein
VERARRALPFSLVDDEPLADDERVADRSDAGRIVGGSTLNNRFVRGPVTVTTLSMPL